GPAWWGVKGAGGHRTDFAWGPGRDGGEPYLRVAGPAAVVDALVTLEALRSVEHAVEHPGVGMIVHAAGSPRHAHDRVDHEVVVGIDVEQQVLVTLGRGPARRMCLDASILHELLEQRLRLLHTP